MDEAAELASYMLDEPGCLTTEQLMDKFKAAMSPHFDVKKHLKKIGLANQTTMCALRRAEQHRPAPPSFRRLRPTRARR